MNEQMQPRYKGDVTRWKDGSHVEAVERPVKVPPARYDTHGVRLDRPYVQPVKNPLLCADGLPRVYRGKLIVLPEGQYEMSVNLVDPKMLEASGRAVRPCDLLAKNRTMEEQTERDIENKQRACRASKQKIRHLLKLIRADHLVTCTYREAMRDIEKLKRDYKEFVRLVRVKHPGL